jgi:diguanylate cyclase (GGDEF)-like protein/PAS domain S-box-containing protein
MLTDSLFHYWDSLQNLEPKTDRWLELASFAWHHQNLWTTSHQPLTDSMATVLDDLQQWLLVQGQLTVQPAGDWRFELIPAAPQKHLGQPLAGAVEPTVSVGVAPSDGHVTASLTHLSDLQEALLMLLAVVGAQQVAKHHYQTARPRLEQVLALAQQVGRNDFELASLVPLCICWYAAGRYTDVVEGTKRGITLAQHANDELSEARLRNTQGLAYRVLGQYRYALENFVLSHQVYNRLSHSELSRPLGNLASLYDHLGQVEQARTYFEQVLDYEQREGLIDDAAITMVQLGDSYLISSDYARARSYYEQALNNLAEVANPVIAASVLTALAQIELKHANLAQAEVTLQRAHEFLQTQAHPRYEAVAVAVWGQVHCKQGQLEAAQIHLENALAQATHIDDKRLTVEIHEALCDVYEKQGKLAEALAQHRLYARGRDELLAQQRERYIAGLMLEFDLTSEQHARQQAELALSVQTELLERVTDGFLAIDTRGIITYANHVIETMTGQTKEALMGSHAGEHFLHLPNFVRKAYENTIKQSEVTTLEFFFEHHQRWFDMRIYPSSEGSTVYLLDITERKATDSERERLLRELHAAQAQTAAKVAQLEHLRTELEAKNNVLEQLSQQDGLTKLLNRRTLDGLFMQELGRAKRHQTPLCVALCDIDNFKQVNDKLSHAVGDETLKRIANILSHNTRAEDIVARYGGEEFVVVFPETPLAAAREACDKIRVLVASDAWHNIHPDLAVTLSMGLVSCLPMFDPSTDVPHDYADYSAMLSAADKQMYRAKHAGKNKVCYPGSEEDTSA